MNNKPVLLICPTCLQIGEQRVLGEYVLGTVVIIQRQHTRFSIDESTLVYGPWLNVVCGYCKFTIHIEAGHEPQVVSSVGTQQVNGKLS